MQFVDEIKIKVQGGTGGNGVIRFNPEYGPSGGNGGDGGNVIFNVTHNCNTLGHLARFSIIKGENGKMGKGEDTAQGRSGKDIIVNVPLGTIVRNHENKKILFDLKKQGKYIIAKGGQGGRGNASFVTNQNKSPRIYEYGMPGEKFTLDLEVRILADCGIIGYPSTGKSTFITTISNAKPQIAPYPFTTLSPVVGVVNHKTYRFVIADLPGLIENASEGKGLGIKFLRHATRCKVLIHFVAADSLNYYQEYQIIRKELRKFSLDLAKKQEIICLSKEDLGVNDQLLSSFEEKIKAKIIRISSFTKKNISVLLDKVIETLSNLQKNNESELGEFEVINLVDKKKSQVINVALENEQYIVSGKGAENLIHRCPLDTEDNIARFNYILNSKKVFHKLKKIGWTINDEIVLPFNKILIFRNGLLQLKPL